MILNKILDEKSCCCDNFIDLHTVSTIDSCNTIMGLTVGYLLLLISIVTIYAIAKKKTKKILLISYIQYKLFIFSIELFVPVSKSYGVCILFYG